MKQYYEVKAVHPDAILLFRVGDFYETFGEDAIKASKILGITLTKRANGQASSVELAGFPYHAVDTYLPKLVRAGQRVAICEQLEDPKMTKKIVKRGVTKLITPGISFHDNILEHKENTFLASVYFGENSIGVAFLDISTGEFYTAEGHKQYIDKLVSNFSPKEIIYQKSCEGDFRSLFGNSYYSYKLDDWIFTPDRNREKLMAQLQVKSLRGFGLGSLDNAVTAAGAILYYLDFTEHKNTGHISSISRIDEDKYVWIDKFSIRNLELFTSNTEQNISFTGVIDKTVSPMGSRMLKRWVSLPLKDISEINERLDITGKFMDDDELRDKLTELLDQVGDMERIISKISVLRVSPREVVQLKNALYAVEKVKAVCLNSGNKFLTAYGEKLKECLEVRNLIETHIYPDPANQIQKGGVIADGVSIELDELRKVARHGKDILNEIQERESEHTGISSLKISFNNVFGYYIEVRNAHKEKVPPEWIRKQTLVNAERYITEELKNYESKILGAEEKILIIEQQIFNDLVSETLKHIHNIQTDAMIVAKLDCLLSFAKISLERKYCKPYVNEGKILNIRNGRHPVIESVLPIGEEYIPNDVYLDDEQQQIIMITGPNMSGKSALLRQTALIVLMAQIGCYVPAQSAEIGIVDKIFTRVGASDNLSQGESTFMVEMLESASILNNISDRSLILLDEIGRGTSTYDGISIAWAMVEYLHEHPRAKAKTLFATHYHELNEMETQYERVKNYNVSVKEVDNSVVFLRKLIRGGTEHSFGIHVAKMAGMPRSIIMRANKILKDLEDRHRNGIGDIKSNLPKASDMQMSIFQLDDPVLANIRDQIEGLDIDNLTPLEALNILHDIKRLTGVKDHK
ncbi:MAG: DNA mismatch repair protein MutS [Rikenellaceae bacterium]|nr:DNA mismatch repair protein MutS [Rikenellaceae bacterium]